MKERGFANPYQVPRLEKIVINMGVGEGRENAKVLDFAAADLQAIAGQKPIVTRAKKSIANFKLREGVPIGAKVTLRGARMYEFLDRLINVALPRVRDFRGVPPKGFDGRGNYALGLREQLIFPEIVYDKIDKVAAWTSTSSRRRGRTRTPRRSSPPGYAVQGVVTMAKTSLIMKSQRQPEFPTRAYSGASCAAARAVISGSSRCAGCASASWPSRARFRAS